MSRKAFGLRQILEELSSSPPLPSFAYAIPYNLTEGLRGKPLLSVRKKLSTRRSRNNRGGDEENVLLFDPRDDSRIHLSTT